MVRFGICQPSYVMSFILYGIKKPLSSSFDRQLNGLRLYVIYNENSYFSFVMPVIARLKLDAKVKQIIGLNKSIY